MSELARPNAEQLRRQAMIYIRQSSPTQVARNLESQERQYELIGRAVSLGWRTEQVVVIDEDLGRTGSEATNRSGFQRLVAEVGLGHVGLVVGIEVSRLARRNADWYNLMDLCALTDTLIADGDGVYHPGDYNSRLVLGLKGTMAEAELHLIRHRLTEGLRHKAAKGTLRQNLPVGLDYASGDVVVLSPDESVRAAINEVFDRFPVLGSARQVVASLREDGLRLPRRVNGSSRITWAEATYPAVHDFLTNPAYAGAFVFGRTRTDRRLDATGQVAVRTRQVARDEWQVCIPDHHTGYIDWQTYVANQDRLAANVVPKGQGGGAARSGQALLAGLLRCGRCGRMMQVGYSGSTGKVPRYACVRALQLYGSSSVCQSLGGHRLEQTVLGDVFAALAPVQLAATARALAEAEGEHSRRVAAFETGVERARFEADRARRQFDAVEPENRLVGRSLEAEWEKRLAEAARAEQALAAQQARRPVALSEEELAWLSRAGADLRAVFEAPTTTNVERKQLLRAVLSEVVVTVDVEAAEARLRICFEGGASVARTMPINRRGHHTRVTDGDTVELVRRLAVHYDDDKIAQILGRQGRKTGTGLTFNRSRVASLRGSRGVPAGPRTAPLAAIDGAEIISLTEAERTLQISRTTLYRWMRDGFAVGVQVTPGGPWHIRVDDELRSKIAPEAPAGWVGLDEAATALGVVRQTVIDRIRRGELRAVHVNRGRRRGLAIEIPTDAPSGRLFG